MASIQEVIGQWKKALRMEVSHLKTQGGSRFTITDGKCLRKHDKGATYWFMLTSDVLLPDSTPIRVEYKNQTFFGKIISVEGFDVVFELDTHFGDEIAEAFLFSEPWELLESLAKRLDTISQNSNKLKRVTRLLTAKSPTKHPKDKIKNSIHEVTLRAKYNATTYIWGPPGTGKTYTLARMIAKHYLSGKKILVMAHSNAAVDVLLLELAEYIQKKSAWNSGDILRYGFSTDPKVRGHKDLLSGKIVERNNPETQQKIKKLESERSRLKKLQQLKASQKEALARVETELNELRAKIKKEEAEYVRNASVLGVTLSKAAMDSLIYERDFDLIVVDEASMAYIPQVAFAASLGKRIVVCGDFKQLPPIAMSDSKLVEMWLKRDIFHGSKIVDVVERGQEHPNLFMLKEQRRMHPDISSFTNSFIYKNKVFDHSAVRKNRQPIANTKPFSKEAATLVDLSKMGAYCLKESASDSRFNLLSALISMQFILSGRENGIDSIGFIAPYKAQARLLSACIQELIPDNAVDQGDKRIISATVHKFQGSERDMIVFDNVDSYPQHRASVLLTDATSDRLINVAVTRARGKLINIVDRKYIETRVSKTKATRALTEHLFTYNEFYTRYELPPVLKETYHPNLQWFGEKENKILINDISKAKQVIISAPYPAKIEKTIWLALQKIEESATITFIAPKKEGIPLKLFEHIPKDLVMPFIIIDGEILWAGTPVMNNINFDSSPEPPYIKCRLVSKRVVKLLNSFLNVQTAKYSKEEIQQRLVSYRPTFTLKQYITSWDQCPTCRSMRKIETAPNGKFMLVCNHCGNKGGVTRRLLQKYIDYINLRCRTCTKPLDATGGGKNLGAECNHCKEKVDVNSLW
ncbi:AAA domain-containing protein [Peribacillus asahii]|uniref:AAA domain-containing protein n=1 Tax=Peribacillus asahii TaxID=228899 RepID=UPI002079CAFE|nr:AAA domain-containing protein [Peribacillus asahii]USK68573.1 AAA domain-containing protein [Peribacillus asahii]